MNVQGIETGRILAWSFNEISLIGSRLSKNEILERIQAIVSAATEFAQENINFETLTVAEAIGLGFQKFNNADDNAYLIPSWLLNSLPDGMVLTSITGNVRTVGTDNIDCDSRGGMSAWKMDFKPIHKEVQIDFVPRIDEEE